MKKITAYLGIISIFYSNIVCAMLPQRGSLIIHGRNSVTVSGAVPPTAFASDISAVSYEDFDVTPFADQRKATLNGHTISLSLIDPEEISQLHLDTSVPRIDGRKPIPDYHALGVVVDFIGMELFGKVHPSLAAGCLKFFREVIAKNQRKVTVSAKNIPDLDCLYYKTVNSRQHLFLRLSSATRQDAERFKRASSGKNIFVENNGDVTIVSEGDISFDHASIEARNVTCKAKGTLSNRASKLKARKKLHIKAKEQHHETVINKWIRESSGAHHFAHAEGISGIDEATLTAGDEIVLEGEKATIKGVEVKTDRFEDRVTHTVNMPQKITLVNYAWEEHDSMFSSSESSIHQTDDFLVPTRYHVNYYRSTSPTKGSSAKFGYTIIKSGANIEILKDIHEDVVVDERHTIDIHEGKSGFSFFGGVSVPDPTSHLRTLHSRYRAGNMVGLSTATLTAIGKGIQVYEDCGTLNSLISNGKEWNIDCTAAFLQTLSHYVNGPSIQFGSRSVDMHQETSISHGNSFIAQIQKFQNSVRSAFAGDFFAKSMEIKTKSFITFDLPQTIHSKMSLRQSGVKMNLFSFACMLFNNPTISTAMENALKSSSLIIACQDNEMHQTTHIPTVFHVKDKLSVEAENGHLTHAQIKAGIVHAVFSNDLVLETLANEKWNRQAGSCIDFGYSQTIGFSALADKLKLFVSMAEFSKTDAGEFEKVIDTFARMVGEEDFYLRVGNILETKSAFLGHSAHDSAREHITAKKRKVVKVKEERKSWNRSFEISPAVFTKIRDAIEKTISRKAKIEEVTKLETAERIEVAGKYAEEIYKEEIENGSTVKQASDTAIRKATVLDTVRKKIDAKIEKESSGLTSAKTPKKFSLTTSSARLIQQTMMKEHVTTAQQDEIDAFNFLIMKRVKEVSQKPNSSNYIRKLRTTIEYYAEQYPTAAKSFGYALELLGTTSEISAGYTLAASALAATGTTIAATPATVGAVALAAGTYVAHKAYEALGEGINYAASKIAEAYADNPKEKQELTADCSFATLLMLASTGKMKGTVGKTSKITAVKKASATTKIKTVATKKTSPKTATTATQKKTIVTEVEAITKENPQIKTDEKVVSKTLTASKKSQTVSLSDAERKGFHGIRGTDNSAGLELKSTITLGNSKYQYNSSLSQKIDGRIYTGHALDQMQNRGIPLSVVKNAISTGKRIEAKRNCWEYVDSVNHVSVIIAKDTGNVVTVKWKGK